jgi:hypothetical protein
MTTPALPITIRYQETAFTMPWHENRQHIHDQVYQIVLDGKNIQDDQKTRLFIYDAVPLDAENEIGLVTARASQFRDHIESEARTLTVRPGDQMTLKVTVSANRRSKVNNVEQVHRIADEAIPEWITSLLTKNAGVCVSNVRLLNRRDYKVHKPKAVFLVPTAQIQANVTIEDAARFAKAFLGGIGRQKGYGVGIMEVAP